jgi:hypothetical protein
MYRGRRATRIAALRPDQRRKLEILAGYDTRHTGEVLVG